MTLEELKAIVASGESETLELKETTGQRVDACETLCAFLNKDGGTVVFGVDRKGQPDFHRQQADYGQYLPAH